MRNIDSIYPQGIVYKYTFDEICSENGKNYCYVGSTVTDVENRAKSFGYISLLKDFLINNSYPGYLDDLGYFHFLATKDPRCHIDVIEKLSNVCINDLEKIEASYTHTKEEFPNWLNIIKGNPCSDSQLQRIGGLIGGNVSKERCAGICTKDTKLHKYWNKLALDSQRTNRTGFFDPDCHQRVMETQRILGIGVYDSEHQRNASKAQALPRTWFFLLSDGSHGSSIYFGNLWNCHRSTAKARLFDDRLDLGLHVVYFRKGSDFSENEITQLLADYNQNIKNEI